MSFTWNDFNVLYENLAIYLFGSYEITGLFMTIFVLLAFGLSGLPMRFAFILILPIISGFVVAGFFGSFTWIINSLLIIIGILYAYAVIKLFS